jgi:methyl-accepting chemotaxis protein
VRHCRSSSWIWNAPGNGSEIVARTNDAFDRVLNSSKKAGELVGEIAAASSEQAQGISQISKAISEMDKVVQQNASSAEESASASGELNAQAMQVREFVNEMITVIRGDGDRRLRASSARSGMSDKRNPALTTG